jgi:hypothetical protein
MATPTTRPGSGGQSGGSGSGGPSGPGGTRPGGGAGTTSTPGRFLGETVQGWQLAGWWVG